MVIGRAQGYVAVLRTATSSLLSIREERKSIVTGPPGTEQPERSCGESEQREGQTTPSRAEEVPGVHRHDGRAHDSTSPATTGSGMMVRLAASTTADRGDGHD
jgi:hypothetical protein